VPEISNALYLRYCLRCRVDQETDKAYYWPQMAQLHTLLEPWFAGWRDCRLRSDQALQRYIGKPYPDRSRRSTFAKAPVGGVRKLIQAGVQDVSTKYLSRNGHLIARFEDKLASLEPFLTSEHPAAVHFFLTEIMAFRDRPTIPDGYQFDGLPHDFYLRIGGYEHQYATTRADPINQAIDLWVRNDVALESEIDALVLSIAKIGKAIQIWRTTSRFCGELYEDSKGYQCVRYHVRDAIEDAVEGRNRYGSLWIDMLN
jgi:hypothetical protein